MPGCERPPSWCDAHHFRGWPSGGPTAVDNLVLVCARHHSIVHADNWTVTITDGKPWFVPPRWLDPARRPRLHARFRTRELDP
jgi:hypothetical protein